MHYELTYIVSALVPETEHSALQAEVLSFFKKAKAEILSGPTSLGRKKLAYPILKQKHGFYVVLEFKLEDTQELKELETSLRHNKNILRHLVIKRRLLNVFDKNGEKNFADEVKKAAPSKRTDSRSNRNNRSAYAPRPSFKKAEAVKVEPATAERGPAIGGKVKKHDVDLSSLDQQLDQILAKEQ
ncbi:MAG: 30S ribosomal protein S6 [Parcubacteria group bacterium GW2011_GWA2_36_10]|nr:MAG: 30S ribosomal protein S6 [Parcubacteria group bacterium GW2011_GWA2_36_10]